MGRNRTGTRKVAIIVAVLAALLAAVLLVDLTDDAGELTGVVIAVDGDLTSVASFDVLSDGETFRFVPAENGDFAFPLPHLRDHLRGGESIVVGYERDTAGNYAALSIRDS